MRNLLSVLFSLLIVFLFASYFKISHQFDEFFVYFNDYLFESHDVDDCFLCFKFLASNHVTNTISISPKLLAPIAASIKSESYLSKVESDSYKDDDIHFKTFDNGVVIYNNTPYKIFRVPVKYNEIVGLLVFDKVINPFSKATFFMHDKSVVRISYNNQMKLFLPKLHLADVTSSCSVDTSENCFDSPTTHYQLTLFHTVLSRIHNIFNSVFFESELSKFIINKCEQYSGCLNFKNAGLSYQDTSLLTMGAEGHDVSIRVLHHSQSLHSTHFLDGMGGGSAPNLNATTDNGSGVIAYWDYFLDPNNFYYRRWNVHPKTYNTIFHELAHAYGYDHESGMTYGFSQHVQEYVDQQFSEKEKDLDAGELVIPQVFVANSQMKDHSILLNFYYLPNDKPYNQVQLTLLCTSKLSGYIRPINSNSLKVDIKHQGEGVLFIRSKTNKSKYFSTLKIAPT